MIHLSALPPVPATILAQLGGPRFKAMTGAKNFVYGPDLLQFEVGRNAKGVTKVQVKLTGDDLYTMAFYKGRGLTLKPVGQPAHGLLNSQLQEIFTERTGLDTHL